MSPVCAGSTVVARVSEEIRASQRVCHSQANFPHWAREPPLHACLFYWQKKHHRTTKSLHCGGCRLDPDLGTKIPHAAEKKSAQRAILKKDCSRKGPFPTI